MWIIQWANSQVGGNGGLLCRGAVLGTITEAMQCSSTQAATEAAALAEAEAEVAMIFSAWYSISCCNLGPLLTQKRTIHLVPVNFWLIGAQLLVWQLWFFEIFHFSAMAGSNKWKHFSFALCCCCCCVAVVSLFYARYAAKLVDTVMLFALIGDKAYDDDVDCGSDANVDVSLWAKAKWWPKSQVCVRGIHSFHLHLSLFYRLNL